MKSEFDLSDIENEKTEVDHSLCGDVSVRIPAKMYVNIVSHCDRWQVSADDWIRSLIEEELGDLEEYP